jgi:hypothetical protein
MAYRAPCFDVDLEFEESIVWKANAPDASVRVQPIQHGHGLFSTRDYNTGDVVAVYFNEDYDFVEGSGHPEFMHYAFDVLTSDKKTKSIVPKRHLTSGLFAINEPFAGKSTRLPVSRLCRVFS